MLWKHSLTTGIILIWASVIVIPYGTYLQTLSPNFQEYEHYVLAEMASHNLTGPGAGVGLAFLTAWPIVAAFCAAIGLLFIFGVLILRSIAGWNRDLALVASGVFFCGCFVGSLMGIQEAIDNLQWRFIVLGVGYLLAAAGLIFGALGAVGFCRSRHGNRLRMSVPPSADYRIQL